MSSSVRKLWQGAAPRTLAGTLVCAAVLAATGCNDEHGSPLGAEAGAASSPDADRVLRGGRVWTGVEGGEQAAAIAIRADRIQAVGSRDDIAPRIGADTEVIDLDGRFVVPGFIDSHTHFDRAGALLLGINLLDVADGETLAERVASTRERLPEGAWIVGGDWGAYAAWQQGSTGQDKAGDGQPRDSGTGFRPTRALIDPLTPDTPVLLSRWDHQRYLANGTALRLAGAGCDWQGVECVDGEPTGRLSPNAAERIRAHQPDKSMAQRLAEARRALARLAENGVTGIHDITPPAQLRVFQRLADAGELSVRVYARPLLDKWDELQAAGIRHGFGSDRLRIGGLKGFVDGIMGNSSARFYEPYLHTGKRGRWRRMATPLEKLQRLIIDADAAGHWPQVHAIGDQAIDTLLDMYETAIGVNDARERRLRVIHVQVLRGPEVAERMARLGLIAEVQPYHAIDDMRWMQQRIGDRARWAYAFDTLRDAGVRLCFGSDWPGTNASWYPVSPIQGIYAAVTRQTLNGEPAGGWYPEERIDVDTALRAYTVNNAWAAGEEALKGTIEPGKLADLTVLDQSPLAVAPSAIKDIKVALTVIGGEVVYRGNDL